MILSCLSLQLHLESFFLFTCYSPNTVISQPSEHTKDFPTWELLTPRLDKWWLVGELQLPLGHSHSHSFMYHLWLTFTWQRRHCNRDQIACKAKKYLLSGPSTEKVCLSLDHTQGLYFLIVQSPCNPLQSFILPVKLLIKITNQAKPKSSLIWDSRPLSCKYWPRSAPMTPLSPGFLPTSWIFLQSLLSWLSLH